MSHGTFSGEPETRWLTETDEEDRRMKLLAPFSFVDPDGKEWDTPVDYSVDGASIPRAVWTLVGSPYTGDYRRASVVHDKACDDAGNPEARREADRMFYHACRAGGCSINQATLLYIGVRFGAWTPLVAAWRDIETRDLDESRLTITAVEQRIQADFRLAAERVLSDGETDDPHEIERRTDAALSAITNIDLRGK
jgi:Protein of unknown function (DUF1353)